MHKMYTLGVTPAYLQHDTRSSLRKSQSQSKYVCQGSTLTSPKNISTNSKKSDHSDKHPIEDLQKIQKIGLIESLKNKVVDGSLLERKKRKEEAMRY